MTNLFNSANYPTREPSQLVIGDRWAWKRTDLGSDYPPASYALSYSLRLEGVSGTSSEEIEITASEDGGDYLIEVGADVTADYNAGDYRWAAYITDSSDATKRLRIGHGSVELVADLDASTSDPRSHAKTMLDYIEAALEGRASNYQLDVLSYQLGSHSASRDPEKLRAWRASYRAEVKAENAAEQVAQGKHDGSLVITRMRA